MLRDQLDALGYDTTSVSNGIEAMRAFFERPYDVVLTDLGMPELDGFAHANFLHEQGAPRAADRDDGTCGRRGSPAPAQGQAQAPVALAMTDDVRQHAARRDAAFARGDR